MQITVQVQSDHLERISKVKKPILAIAELVWNGFDADADNIIVEITKNSLGGLEEIIINDDGHGIRYEDAIEAFGKLGGSWKKGGFKSAQKKRLLHGRAGKGRFRAFSIGRNVEWTTFFLDNGQMKKYLIKGTMSNLAVFDVSDPVAVSERKPGTTVTISGIDRNFDSLSGEKAMHELSGYFALYLRLYPKLKLIYDGQEIKGSLVERSSRDYIVGPVEIQGGRKIVSNLTVVEWTIPMERAIFLCDKDGFTLEQTTAGIHAPQFNFTAYLKSDFFRELDESNALALDELNSDLKRIIDSAKEKIKQHFRERAAQQAELLVEEWKKEQIYPFEAEPKDIIEKVERQVFDACAISVSSYLPDFDNADRKNKKLTLHLLKNALETSPEQVRRILQDVLNLPKEKQEELARLLNKTTLVEIINASKVVADRLDFLKGLEILVFEDESKEKLSERKQLHRIVAQHTWIFGEEFHLSVDDDSLSEVLAKHLQALGREPEKSEPVRREDDSEGIVDLMLSRRIPHNDPEKREHLIVELKRPSKKIDNEVLNQIQSYAFAVAADERFKDTNTKWVFWAISNDMTNGARRLANQAKRPAGLFYEDSDQNITIWSKTWAQIIESCQGRLKFYHDRLKYYADRQSALEYLQKTHFSHLPEHLQITP